MLGTACGFTYEAPKTEIRYLSINFFNFMKKKIFFVFSINQFTVFNFFFKKNLRISFSFTLAPCLCEFDISMLDRLSPVFNGSPFTSNKDHPQPDSTLQQSGQSNPFILTLESSSIDIRLR